MTEIQALALKAGDTVIAIRSENLRHVVDECPAMSRDEIKQGESYQVVSTWEHGAEVLIDLENALHPSRPVGSWGSRNFKLPK